MLSATFLTWDVLAPSKPNPQENVIMGFQILYNNTIAEGFIQPLIKEFYLLL